MQSGILYAIAAGLLICLQNVFVTRTGERVGFWEANALVHGFGFILAFSIFMLAGRTQGAGSLLEVPKLYWVGLFIGVLIVFSVMQGVTHMGAGYAIPIMLSAQILGAMVVSRFGLFGEAAVIPSPANLLGIVMLLAGVVLTQLR